MYNYTCVSTQLKLYTRKEAQSGEIFYKDEEKGYMCDFLSFNWYLTVFTVIITIAAICISCKVLQSLLNTKSKRADVKRAVFFSIGNLASFVNVYDAIIITYEVYIYFKENNMSDLQLEKLKKHQLVKASQVGVGIFVFGIGGIIGCCCGFLNYLPQTPPWILNCLCLPRICFCSSNCAYFLYFANFFYFSYIVGLNVLPTFLMLFITPIETLSVLVFFVSLLSSGVMFMTIIIFQIEIHKKMNGAKKNTKLCATLVSAFIYFLVLISIVILMIVFLFILASVKTNNTSYLAPVILSFGSTILSILGGYVTMRILSKKNNTQNSNESEMESGTEMSERTIKEDSDDGEDTEEKPLLQDESSF